MEKSEKLAQLNRHHCRPLDRVTMQNPNGDADASPVEDADEPLARDD